ncbi:MAG: asparagine synthase (glutamine-hydrolyzing) [Candidatus Omnitrophota bacterium]
MCGIAGVLDFRARARGRAGLIRKMVAIQKHRGPDDEGFYLSDDTALGHCRLSIIDLSADAHQPMANRDGTKWIIYNGEIYNYLELRKELVDAGYGFKSHSDTEVILHAFEEWGEDALRRFNGMWSFVIWDEKKRELFASRDRFGVKPFYYYRDNDVFIFASEIKALLLSPSVPKEPNDRAIYDYLSSGYGYMDIGDYTFFKSVYKLNPGHYMRFGLNDGTFTYRKFWDLGEAVSAETANLSADEYIGEFRALLEDAVRLRLRSDVDVGVMLSGGLDSSSIACIADRQRNRTLFSVSSYYTEAEADERCYIDEVLKTSDLDPFFVSAKPDNLFSDLHDIIWHQEEPYSTLSILPQWYVMRKAHEKNIRVLLTGQAGDETLGGYDKYYFYLFADLFSRFMWKRCFDEARLYEGAKGGHAGAGIIAAQVMKILLSYSMPGFIKRSARKLTANAASPFLNKDFTERFGPDVRPERKFRGILNNELCNAFRISPLPSLLHTDDRSSMAFSVETRSPFLDYRLVQYVFGIPAEWKIRDGRTKYILREAMRGIVPPMVLDRRDKMGFPTPLKTWISSDIKSAVDDVFSSGEFLKRPYFDASYVKQGLPGLMSQEGSEYTVWSWLNLELWFRRYIDGPITV